MPKLILRKNAAWFVCTISNQAAHNWGIAKEHSLWGIPSSGRKIDLNVAAKGDYLIFYMARKGFIAIAQLSNGLKVPRSKEEAPWAGGIYRYGAVMPFKLLLELDQPFVKPFKNNMMVDTHISVTGLRKGFTRINPEDGTKIALGMQNTDSKS